MLAFLEEAQQYGAVNEVVAVVRLLHKALLVPLAKRYQVHRNPMKAMSIRDRSANRKKSCIDYD